MTSFLPFTDIRKRWSYALNVNTAFYMHVFHFFVKIIAFCTKECFQIRQFNIFLQSWCFFSKYEHNVLTCQVIKNFTYFNSNDCISYKLS